VAQKKGIGGGSQEEEKLYPMIACIALGVLNQIRTQAGAAAGRSYGQRS
jgi:hypothetical protein